MSTVVNKARIFMRRGTDANRLGTTLCEGELGYSTDGKRVFAGDSTTVGGNSLGSKVFVLASGGDVTTLTAASADGRAEVGDFAFVPAATYNISSVNSYFTDSDSSTPNTSAGTLYTLSARDGGTGDLTWVFANSAIPVTNLDIPDNSLNADQIHGGTFSGDMTFSDDLTALSSLTLSGVAASAANPSQLTGSVIYPLGITATSQVTAVSSVDQLGVNDSNIIRYTQYFDAQTISADATYVDNTGGLAPSNSDSDWLVVDLAAKLSSAGVTLPASVTYPKAAIIAVYNDNIQPDAERTLWGLYSSHADSSYSTSGNFQLLSRWGPDQDNRGSRSFYAFGNQLFVRLSGTSNNIVLQYTRHKDGGSVQNSDLTIELIGIQY